MNIRRANVSTEGSVIKLRLEVGHATNPIIQWHELDRATALYLSAELAKAAGRADGADLMTIATVHRLTVALQASEPIDDGLLELAVARQAKPINPA